MTDSGVPQVLTALLSAEREAELMRDLRAIPDGLDIRLKRSAGSHADEAAVDLDVAHRALDGGASVQVRYRAGGRAWCDTLRRVPKGLMLVRMEQ